MMSPELYVGITSWNSQLFLPTCLEALRRSTKSIPFHVHVVDNCSEDESAQIARQYGAEVTVKRTTQAEALNLLIDKSDCPYTLLIHADVILLSQSWFHLCSSRLNGHVVLVSPEDIGCGPLTRPFGAGKPESSFMLYETAALKKLRTLTWRRKWRLPIPRWQFDFSGGHLTHTIPSRLSDQGMDWCPMNVYPSNHETEPLYIPASVPQIWSDELSFLRYGLGNFYGLDGVITHYHNWYDRVMAANNPSRQASGKGKEFPPDFVNQYSQRFLSDYKHRRVDFPRSLTVQRKPQAL